MRVRQGARSCTTSSRCGQGRLDHGGFIYRLFKVDLAQDFGHDIFIYQGSRLIQLKDLVMADRMIWLGIMDTSVENSLNVTTQGVNGLVKSVDSLCPSFAVVTRDPRHSFLGCIRVLCTLHCSVGMR